MAYVVRDGSYILHGFTELQRSLQRLEGGAGNFGVEYELQHRLRLIGESVTAVAPGFVTHKFPARGGGEPLEGSARVSVTKRSVSVYSTSLHGGVQNTGGGPKAGWKARGPHVTRAKASKWMIRAAESKQPFVQEQADGLVDWVALEIERA